MTRVGGHRKGGPSLRRMLRDDEWVRPLLGHYRALFVLGIALGTLAVLFAGGLMFVSGYMISLAAFVPTTVLALHLPSILVRIFGIGKPLIDYAQRLVTHDWVLRATSRLRRRLFSTLEHAQSSVVESKRSGEVLALLAEDVEHVQDLCVRSIFPYLIAIVVWAIVLLALGAFDAGAALLIGVLLGVVLFVVPLLSLGIVRPAAVRRQELEAAAYASALEGLRGLGDWVLAGREDGFLADLGRERAAAAVVRAQQERAQRWRAIGIRTVMALVVIVVFAFAGAAFGERLPSLQTPVVAGLASLEAIDATAAAANWVAAFVLCAFPILEMLSAAPEEALDACSHERAVQDLNRLGEDGGARCCQERDAASAPIDVRQASSCAPSARPTIELEHVSFAYPGATRPVIEDMTLTVPFGSHVALMGRSGSGKSTLARLVYGELVPTSGTIRVGGTDPAAFIEPHRTISVLYQHAHIFDTTLRENLLVAKGDASDEELRAALERVGLGGLGGPGREGLGMRLGEGGERLSGGQRQRVALARMLLVDAPIVLLDEPFLWLDEETADALGALVAEVMAGRTVVMIAHQGIDAQRYDAVIRL